VFGATVSWGYTIRALSLEVSLPRTMIFRWRPRLAIAAFAGSLCLAALVATVSRAGAAPAPPTGTSWSVDLSRLGAAEVNVAHAGGVTLADAAFHPAADPDTRGYGLVEFAPRPVGQQASAVRVELTATVPAGASAAVEVRGRQSRGGWTEWRAASAGVATLPVPATLVQVRLVLRAGQGASPVVSGLRLTALPGTARAQAITPAATPVTYRAFATREGLVGSTTANGHVIAARDHFVALPSRRGLSSNGSTQFSVRVCNPNNGRCETAPVWDVGPWNTHDDYWNPAGTRERFGDLPRGTPEAQAARLNGYNGGKDEFGRTVANPAGIDLADGTFRDGLGMSDNGYVTVTYLWTSGGTTPTPTWPTVSQGASGETVRTIQYLLNQAGANLSVDGDFGANTKAAVRSYQSARGLEVDGVVGPQTWANLAVTIQRGSTGNAVRALQSQLTAHGFATTVDGNFGPATEANVRAYQGAAGIGVDGQVGPQTWQSLVSS
jgi:peptidoglycan hydrolase-like protein with peptidoglycan-binding domain